MAQPKIASAPDTRNEGVALLAAIDAVPATAPTACVGWTAHGITAHLAAGAKETADLIEESLAGRPARPTRGFEEREAPMRALSDAELRRALTRERNRKVAALEALAQRTDEPAIAFTGTRVTVPEFETHGRSEAAIHRWDLVGRDDIGDELLAQPDLTAHAIKILNRMPVLYESARAMGTRSDEAHAAPARIVFRSPGQPDVVLVAAHQQSHFEIAEGTADGDAILTTDAANRLLVLWGRKSSDGLITFDGDPAVIANLDSVLWPAAQPWPRSDTARLD